MPSVVGVRLRPADKVLTFDATGTEPDPGDMVIVSTERGEEIGEVVTGVHEVAGAELQRKLKPVLRIATDRDLQIAEELREKEVQAMHRCREMIEEHGLDMKPVAVEALFDERKIVFYFTAEERVDFRELVKELAREFRARIDMRQIGVRDEARMLGGIGHCGQPLCCRRYMEDFEPVSIRMAKAQDLPLNPLKISGVCGRLMCCLRYEYEAYKDFKSRAPKVGAAIETPRGDAKVVGLDAPRERVTLQVDGGRVNIPLAEMECEGCSGGRPCRVGAEALAAAQSGRSALAISGLELSSTEPRDASKDGRRRGGSSGRQKAQPASSRAETGEAASSQGGQPARRGTKRRRSSRGGPRIEGGTRQSGSSDTQGGSKSGSKGGDKTADKRAGQGPATSGGKSSSQGTGRRRRRRRPESGSGGEPKGEPRSDG